MNLTQKDGEELIKLARQSISSYFSGKDLEVSDDIKKKFSSKQGVFVTLTIDGDLRGCIGFPEPVYALYGGVIEGSKSAAFSDPRFDPLSKEEFSKVKIEVSVLTVPELIEVKKAEDYLNRIKIGEDGLIVKGDFGSGLLLPQVFTEYNCDVKKALEMTCNKGGLHSEAWKDIENTKVYKFQSLIFSE